MITVKRYQEETSQSMIGKFLKRVKKSNTISRKRKIEVLIKPLSHLQKQRKAMRMAKYAEKQTLIDRMGKNSKF
jgi:hypothetical protein